MSSCVFAITKFGEVFAVTENPPAETLLLLANHAVLPFIKRNAKMLKMRVKEAKNIPIFALNCFDNLPPPLFLT